MMDNVVSAEIIAVAQKVKQFFFGCFMKDGAVKAECSDVMDLMILQTDFNIYKGIARYIG